MFIEVYQTRKLSSHVYLLVSILLLFCYDFSIRFWSLFWWCGSSCIVWFYYLFRCKSYNVKQWFLYVNVIFIFHMSVLPCLKHTINDNQHLFKISLQVWYKYLLVLLTINQPGTFFHILFEYILLIPSLVLFSWAILLVYNQEQDNSPPNSSPPDNCPPRTIAPLGQLPSTNVFQFYI